MIIMKKKTTKIRAYLTIDREEQFLNEMCQKGWKPVKIILGMFFKFERCQPGEYIARVTTSMKTNKRDSGKKKREQMIEFLTDSGAEIVPEINIDAGTRIYAIRPASMGEFEINTDIAALIADYSSRRKYHRLLAIAALVIAIIGIAFGLLFTHLDGYVCSSAMLEFVMAGLELLLSILVTIPIPKYSRKIKELREQSEVQE